ncbi:UNVERIFIED_ORG: hypothetical protein EDC93_1011112 [Bacillus cereus]
MELENLVESNKFHGDPRIEPYITVHCNVAIEQNVADLFAIATNRIAESPDFPNLRKRKLFVLFSEDGKYTVNLLEQEVATQGSFAFFSYEKLRKYNDVMKVVIFTEELVHHFWDEEDELVTKRIVEKLLPGVRYDEKADMYLPE